MRQIGKLADQDEATRFADYLLTQGVEVKAEPNSDGWIVWVRDENQLDQARRELEQFAENPEDPRYRQAQSDAAVLRREEQRRREKTRRNMHDMSDRWRRPAMQRRPLTVVLVALSAFVTLISVQGVYGFLEFDIRWSIAGLFTFGQVEVRDGATLVPVNGYRDILQGELWRLVTPIFLHFGLIHIAFNLYMLNLFGGVVEERRHTWRLGLMVLLMAVVSNVAEYQFTGNVLFGGMSGVVYGLFGYVWMKAKFDPRSGFYLDPMTVIILLVWLVLGFTGGVGPIANVAHLSGLLVGMVLGYAPLLLRRK